MEAVVVEVAYEMRWSWRWRMEMAVELEAEIEKEKMGWLGSQIYDLEGSGGPHGPSELLQGLAYCG